MAQITKDMTFGELLSKYYSTWKQEWVASDAHILRWNLSKKALWDMESIQTF